MRGLPEDVIETLAPFVRRTDLVRLRPVTGIPGRWLPVLLRTGAITLGQLVFFRRGAYNSETARGLSLIAHEAMHVGQFRELGIPRFLYRYSRQRIGVRFRHDRHPIQIPCIELQAHVRSALREAGWP